MKKVIRSIKGVLPKDNFSEVRDHYVINDQGDVFSYRYKKVKQLKTPLNSQGNKSVGLLLNTGEVKTVTIHRLVALAFVKNDDIYKNDVIFKDKNKLNCSADNLVWVNHSSALHKSGSVLGGKREKPKEYYETFQVTKGHFKSVCKNRGWNFDNFETVKSVNRKNGSDAMYFFIEKESK